MAMKGYHSYRGRQGSHRRWPLALLLVLILAAACAFLFLQRYITYSDDGSFHLDLPILDRLGLNEEPSPSPSAGQEEQDYNLVIEEPQNSEPEPEIPVEEPEPAPAPYTPRRLLGFSAFPESADALTEALENMGADGFVFTAKADKGGINYTSAAVSSDYFSSSVTGSDLLSDLCMLEGIYTVAKINCFHDTKYAFANMEAAGVCQRNGYIWYDSGLNHWLDPEKEAARDYVIFLALECAQLGFDELLLEDLCYPSIGKLHKIDYSKNAMEKPDALALFLNELRSELEPYGVRISLLLTEAELTGIADNTDKTGVVAAQLLPLVDAVYVETADLTAAETAVSQLLGGETIPTIIPIVPDETATGGWYLPQ